MGFFHVVRYLMSFQIFFKTNTDKTVVMDWNPNITIQSFGDFVKEKVIHGDTLDGYRFVCGTKQFDMQDPSRFNDIKKHIKPHCTIFVLMRSLGEVSLKKLFYLT